MTVDTVRLPRRILWSVCALALSAGTLLAGCHAYTNVSYGTGVVTIHDVSNEFTSYIVLIDSITLTRSDGLLAYALASPELVDLAKLQDLTELIDTPAIPAGTYTSLSLVLDYSTPLITVNVNGTVTQVTPLAPPIAPATTGTAVGQVPLTVTFDPNNPLVVNAQQSTRLALAVNLAAGNSVDYTKSPPTLTVQPTMTASPVPEDSTAMRARGIMVIAQPGSSNFIVNMRPFNDLQAALGALTVNVKPTTYFNINGTVLTGAAGLAAMQSLQVSTPIATYGTLGSFATITPSFDATAVYAGTSLESPLDDYVTGVVSGRSGDTLTIHGATCVSRFGSAAGITYVTGAAGGVAYFDEVPVTVGSSTLLTEDGVVASGLTTQSISVGQLITVAGQATSQPYCLAGMKLDATQGLVRLASTPLWGTLGSAAAGSLTLDLVTLGNTPASVFKFSGTGSAAANDAVATAYAIDTGTLNFSGTTAGTLFHVDGIVNPFGAAPPDFTSSAVSEVGTSTQQVMVVEWDSGGAAKPFTSASAAGLTVDLSNADLSTTVRYISTGPVKTDLKTLPSSPKIVFASGVPLNLSINVNDTISVFNSVPGFATLLASTLTGTNKVFRLMCVGTYSAVSNTFTASQVVINLQI